MLWWIDAILCLVAVAALLAIAMLWWSDRRNVLPVKEAISPETTEASAPHSFANTPAVRFPVDISSSPSRHDLPPLDASDTPVSEALAALLGREKVISHLQTDGFIRRVVATVDNLGRTHATARLWPISPTPQRFAVASHGEQVVLDGNNELRYKPFVLLLESLNIERLVSLYRSMYPLFQQAYEELGFPRGNFNDRLVEIIDHLLAAPEPTAPVAVRLLEVQGPMRLERPWVHYEFVEPELESMSAGQKIMVRVGLDNERRLKIRLKQIRDVVAVRSTGR